MIDKHTETCIMQVSDLTKVQVNFLKYCKTIGWGKMTVTVKNGEPVFAQNIIEDVKFD